MSVYERTQRTVVLSPLSERRRVRVMGEVREGGSDMGRLREGVKVGVMGEVEGGREGEVMGEVEREREGGSDRGG